MLLDDGLGIPEMLIPWDAHASFCATVKRIVRVETEAEVNIQRAQKQFVSHFDFYIFRNYSWVHLLGWPVLTQSKGRQTSEIHT